MKNSIVKTLAALAALILTALPLSAAEVVTYYHNDHLGSPIAATDDTGTVVWQQAYDPWGEPVTTTANNRAYNGKWRDLETGLNDYAARWQSSSIGRFTQIDKAPWHEGNIHSFNRYAYANNSPYRYKDPDGNLPVDTIWDAANVLYDGARIAIGSATGNDQMVAEATTDMAVDLGAMLIPYVPAGSSKLARMGDDAKSGVQTSATNAGEPNRIYSAKELKRRSENPRANNSPNPNHNFPESFNAEIFKGNKTVVNGNYHLYTKPGTLNGRSGTFEIGVRPSSSGKSEVITHRFFRPSKK